MPRDYKIFLEDILLSTQRIQQYLEGFSRESFIADQKTFDAVVRNLEIIGEAAKKLPEDIRALSPKIEWQKMCGLRDILAHEYFGIDADIIWDICENKLRPLQVEMEKLLD